ncbi:MAG: bifunctional nicotinamidase/pyrazinamidase [Planctomycetes bacterium]|nr:bifunctional nicotinamidase/pyrazinamidase [Planctomycetota bacterium]MBL7040368.1 bifunctional nicotinamidase/pyrazinamidase [Pirellulaceae bacterium]
MQVLLLVDIQNDFVPGGALAVPDGDQVISVANALIPRFELVVATKDWHPADHGSFARQHPNHKIGDVIDLHGLQQILWPDHCIQNTAGAEFVETLDTDDIDRVFFKGTDADIDSYSGIFDNGRRKATGLGEYLRESGIRDVYVMGLATDYCVKFTVLDALDLGFHVHVIEDGCRGVDLKPGDSARAIEEMRKEGAYIVRSDQIARRGRVGPSQPEV